MNTLHFLRPWFLLGLLPTAYLAWRIWRYHPISEAWKKTCDPHLLDALLEHQPGTQKRVEWMLVTSLFLLWIAAAGPAWKKLPMPAYMNTAPKMIVLDVSKSMLAADLTPNRLQRAKFVVQDILKTTEAPPIGLIAYTQEPFIVSPLTHDTQTISALLPALDTDTPPIGGQNLSLALEEAALIIQQAHYQFGSLLVLTGTPPDEQARTTATQLHEKGFTVSILQIAQMPQSSVAFKHFAESGGGMNLSLSGIDQSIYQWLRLSNRNQAKLQIQIAQIPRWQDEGRWFLIPALLLLLPVFQRGRLESMMI